MSAEEESRPDSEAHLAALGRVMGELVHDLNNEITVLQGWALLARGELAAGRLAGSEVERVVEISNGLGLMLRDMLGTVAGQAVSPEVVFDPRALAEETLAHRVRALGGVEVCLDSLLPPETRVAGRASFWTRALSNLLINATRHARTRVEISLRLAASATGRAEVLLRVEDDGDGVDPDDREAVFQPLWRGDQGGSGLGLSAVAWAVAQLRGTVAYRDDSALGGAAFEIRVPVAPRLGELPRPSPPADTEDPLRGTRILVVDDDPAVRSALCRILQRSGAEVRSLDPADEPDEHLVEAILSELPEVILLDLRLGDRGAMTLWNRMCIEVPRLAARTVFVSGAAPGEPDWEEAGVTGQPLLAKPFDLRELARVVHRLRARG